MRNTVSSMALAGTEDRSRARRRTIAIELVLGSALLVLFSVFASRLEVLETVFWALSTFGITALHEAIFLSPAFAAFLIYRRSREYRAERTRALAAERTALAGEQRFQDLVEVSGDWIWETGPDHRFTFMSPHHDQAKLLPSDRVIGRARWDIISDINRRQLDSHRADMEARRTIRNFVYPVVDPAGKVRHFRVNGKPIFTAEGAFLGYRGITTDVTAEIKAQEQITIAHRRLVDAIESMPAAVMMFDAEERLVLWNSRIGNLYAPLRHLFVAGTPYADILRDTLKLGIVATAGLDQEGWVRQRLEAFRAGDSFETVPTSDGRWLQALNHKTTDGGAICVRIDVTELKQREAELERQRALLQATLDNIDQGLCAFDADRRLVAWNERLIDLLELPRDAVYAGADFEDLVRVCAARGDYGSDDAEALVARHVDEIAVSKRRLELTRTTPKGRVLQSTHAPTPNGGIVTTYSDVTELKRQQAELERQARLLETALASMSQGLAVYDRDLSLVLWNDAYLQQLGYTPGFVAAGATFADLIRDQARRGDFGAVDIEATVAEHCRRLSNVTGPSVYVRERPNGSFLEVRRNRMPDGNIVNTFTDVTELKRHQATLERQSALLQATLDNMGQGLCVYDKDLRLVAWNQRYFELFDVPSELARFGTRFEEMIRHLAERGDYGPGDVDDIVADRVHRVVERSDLWSYNRVRPNGTVLEIRRRAMPGGGFVSVYTDVTERVQAERILQDSEARAAAARRQLGDAIESMSEAFALFDPERRLVAWNRKLVDLHPAIADLITFGASYEELTRALVERGQVVRPYQSADQYLAHCLAITSGGKSAVDCQLREGGWVRTTARRTSDGGIVTVHSDVTEAKRREVELMTLSERLRTRSLQFNVALDNMVQGLCMFDAEGRLIVCNRRYLEIFGLTPEIAKPGVTLRQLLEHSIATGVYADDEAERIIARRLNAAAATERTQAEARLSNGRVIEVISQPMADGGTLATYEDITARRKVEHQLRHAQKMDAIGRMTGGIAHEFNNLLTAMGGFTRMALRRVEDPEHVTDCLSEVVVAADRAASLTRQMLAFSRHQILEPRVVTVVDIVSRNLRMLGSLLGEQIRLTTSFEDESAMVVADPDQLAQVIMNLAINARDAMPEGGEIEIGTCLVDQLPESAIGGESKPGRHVAIFVRDSGCGMDEETKKKIFEPFFTTKDPGHGTGLGLSVVHGFVEQSGGQIDVQSSPGRGSTFTVYLPLAATEPPVATGEADEATSAPAAGGATVLLVEDEDAVRRLAKAELELLGFKVLIAANGKEALAVHGSHAGRIDLLLTDVVMPEMGGPETARALTAARPGLKVIFMTGYSSRGHFRRSDLDEGAVVLNKPFTDKRLAETIQEVLGKPLYDDGPGDGTRRAA